MARWLKIDFVSDVSCPWCIIGLLGLEQALARLGGTVAAEIHFQPFELNPDMPPEGQSIAEHIAQKYGSSPAQLRSGRDMIRDRAAALGFTITGSDERRIYNTFDAHRLLHWAGMEGRQPALKHALFEAYFTDEKSPADPEILIGAAAKAGLNPEIAREILNSDRYAQEVREAEQHWRARGISAVPAIVIDDRFLISGGQPPEAFEQALRQITQKAA